MSIKEKLISGAFWNSISQFGSQGLNFIITIILARLLSPSDFGLLGQVSVMTGLMAFFSEFGFLATLIQKKDVDDIDYNTAFYSIIFFSFTLYAIVYAAAPLLGYFYDNNDLVLITRVVFIQFILQPVSFINEVIEIKNLRYNKLAISELVALIISGSLGIIMAFNGFGVWSLVWQNIIRLACKAIIMIIITTWRPRLQYSFKIFLTFIKSGAHFTYRNLTLYLSENIDYLLIGKIAGASMLGIYNMAFRMSNYPFTKVQQIFGQMLFPAFNQFNDDMERVRKNYLRLSLFGGVILIPVLMFIFFGIEPIVKLLLGEKWTGVITIVKILVVYLTLSSISFADESIMLSLNKIKIINVIKTITSLFLLGLGYLATKEFGARGMATVFTTFSICYLLTTKIILMKIIKIKIITYLIYMRDVFLLAISSAALFLLFNIIMHTITDNSLLLLLGQGIILAIILTIYILNKKVINIKTRSINLDVL